MIYKNYINGAWSEIISENGKETFDNVNPANTTQVIGQFKILVISVLMMQLNLL